MRTMIFKAGLLATVLLPAAGIFSPLASADDTRADPALANPVLIAKSYFSTDPEITDKVLEITRLDLSVSLLPGYAETTAIAEFYNPTQAQLEGEFVLDLPTGSIITGYGLDIEGEIIDGVLVEKKKAKKTFENRIRAGIDPGLAEITRENAFKTRVFPILPQTSRTIKVTFLSPISAAQPYRLPLNTGAAIDTLSIAVTAKGAARPAVTLPGQMRLDWDESSGQGRAEGQDLTPDGALTITPQDGAGWALERHTSGQRFLSATMAAPEQNAGKPPKTIRVYWDTSLSSSDASEQQQVLFETLKTFGDAKIDLIPFASTPRPDASLNRASAEAVVNAIGELTYNGATSLEALYASEAGRKRADVCLLVSDGRATLGNAPLATLPCKLFTLSGADDANRGVLQMLAQRSGGQFIDTNTTSTAQMAALVSGDTPYLKSVRIDGREYKSEAVWSGDGDRLRMLVPVPEGASRVAVDFGDGAVTERFNQIPAYSGKRLGAAWANQWLVQAAASGADRAEMVELSRTYSVASEVTSFLVLEAVSDYAANRIALPATGFSKQQRAEYGELIQQAEADDRAAREVRLSTVIDAWGDQIDWYQASYKWTPSERKQAGPEEDTGTSSSAEEARSNDHAPNTEMGQNRSDSQLRRQENNAPAPPMDGLATRESEFADEIVVTGTRRDPASQGVTSVIDIKPWTPDRPYLNAVKGQCGTAFDTTYRAQRGEHGALPGFYLEMADARAACGDKDAAAEIALSALELDAANTDTMSAVANRLLSYGRVDTAVALYAQVSDDDPARPQPWRDLALALEIQAGQPGLNKRQRRALYEQAIGHLNHIIETPWDGAYDGIELIAVMEANRIAERLSKIGGEASLPDEQLEQLLDVDLRVVVNWNVDAVDMDLWVNEPTGERSYYGYALTQIGGRLSNDMTAGYGPEEYLLKQALPGEYSIEMNYFSSDIINPNGAVTLRAHIYRNWGRANQTVSVVDLEFTDQEASNYLVAKIVVE